MDVGVAGKVAFAIKPSELGGLAKQQQSWDLGAFKFIGRSGARPLSSPKEWRIWGVGLGLLVGMGNCEAMGLWG